MRVERSTKDQMLGRLSHLAKEKDRSTKKAEAGLMGDEEETDFQVVVKKKDDTEKQKKEERARKRKEKKQKKKGAVEATPNQPEETTGGSDRDEGGVEDHQADATDPTLAAMMGFSSFGGGGK
jgi:hypothetical protein